MIIATVLKNFKCYKGINVVPFSKESLNFLNIIIGNNGVGKSAILEALDTLFNDAHWIVNNDTKTKDDSQVAALFLLKKETIDKCLDAREQSIVSEISEFFWTFNPASMVPYRGYENLFDTRNYHLPLKSDYYLIFIGKACNSKHLGFLTFDTKVRSFLTVVPKPAEQTLHKILYKLLDLHAYIYIPVETTVSSFVKLQNRSMQVLMNKEIKVEISKNLNEKRVTRSTRGKKDIKLSILDMINEVLEEYVSTVESDIQKQYFGYSYKPGPKQTSKLTANHVSDTMIEAYYSKRIFRKDGKLIEDLSSGEKRIILIDIISAFIQKNNPSRELIVAIDEPESSLHISKCYDQFTKINKIAIEHHHQIFVTTHWYGSLPILKSGSLIHIDDKSVSSYSSLKNYFEKRGDLPNDIQLKGYFDLTSSLLYAYRNSKQTMILVEGYEDKRYLEYYLQNDSINIIPVGGCSNVKKIFSYLYTPLSDKEMAPFTGTQKIICLIDTDIQCPTIGIETDIPTQILVLRRLHQEGDQPACIIKCDSDKKNPTEVEEVLEPTLFYESLKETIESFGSEKEKEAFSHYVFNTTVKNSRIKGDYSILQPNEIGLNIAEDKKTISSFIDSHKEDIAIIYVSHVRTEFIPEWIKEIKELCDLPIRRK